MKEQWEKLKKNKLFWVAVGTGILAGIKVLNPELGESMQPVFDYLIGGGK